MSACKQPWLICKILCDLLYCTHFSVQTWLSGALYSTQCTPTQKQRLLDISKQLSTWSTVTKTAGHRGMRIKGPQIERYSAQVPWRSRVADGKQAAGNGSNRGFAMLVWPLAWPSDFGLSVLSLACLRHFEFGKTEPANTFGFLCMENRTTHKSTRRKEK